MTDNEQAVIDALKALEKQPKLQEEAFHLIQRFSREAMHLCICPGTEADKMALIDARRAALAHELRMLIELAPLDAPGPPPTHTTEGGYGIETEQRRASAAQAAAMPAATPDPHAEFRRNIRCSGRHLHIPDVRTRVLGDHLVMRVDCSVNPEYWFEANFKLGDLVDMLAQLHCATLGDSGALGVEFAAVPDFDLIPPIPEK